MHWAQEYGGAGHELLVSLQQAARRTTEAPHGLWWLCPMEDPKPKPALDGRPSGSWDRAIESVVSHSLFSDGLRTGQTEAS